MQTLLTLPYLTIYLLGPGTAHPALELSWSGFVASADFREIVPQTLALGREHRVRGWLSDDRLLGALRPRDLDWVAEAGMSALNQLPIERFAHLEATEVLNRLTIHGMYDQVLPQLNYPVRRFDDLEQARLWATGAD